MAKVIMVQGTMSNVGKSVLVGGLCRIFKQDGYSVAPFKSQNMALNSYITENGLEMGRAQVMQAEASGIKPDVRMNPILLKPTNDKGSQVIVNGEVLGNMTAVEYYKNKLKFIPDIMKAYNELAQEYDIIVIEGAGSPAEINLKKDDIVNMGMAKMVKAPVLLVGDIDRGGVFAQLIGTVDLLDDDEKQYIKGLIINKFRGDISILQSGIDMLEEKAKKDVIGVVPYTYLDIDDEDSLTERFNKKDNAGLVDIAVIRLPRISNFTDFNVFECIDGVSLRYVSSAGEIGDADMVILPGTKNTIEDLIWIRENGIEAKIKQLSSKGKIIFGICGGYQMLGESLVDDDGLEYKGEIRGIGLLPIKTVFKPSKTRTRVNGEFKNINGILKNLKGLSFEGYEIHLGVSQVNGDCMTMIYDEVQNDNPKCDGANVGNVYGSYVHGIFDNENVSKEIISSIMIEKGIDSSAIKSFNMKEYKEKQYDLLAQCIRDNVDMKKIYQILEEGLKV